MAARPRLSSRPRWTRCARARGERADLARVRGGLGRGRRRAARAARRGRDPRRLAGRRDRRPLLGCRARAARLRRLRGLAPDRRPARVRRRDPRGRAAMQALGNRSALPSGRDTYRQYADYTTELKAARRRQPRAGARGDDRHLARGATDPGRRDRPGRPADRRRPPGLPQLRRPPRPRVAVGRVPDGVRPRPGRAASTRATPRHEPALRRPRRRRPDRQRRRLRRLAQLRVQPADRRRPER